MQVYGELILEHAGLPRKCDSKPWRTLSGLQLWSPHRRHDMTRTRLAMQVAPAAELEGVDEGVEARLEQLRGGAGCDVALRRCSAWEGGGRLCRKTVRVRVGVGSVAKRCVCVWGSCRTSAFSHSVRALNLRHRAQPAFCRAQCAHLTVLACKTANGTPWRAGRCLLSSARRGCHAGARHAAMPLPHTPQPVL